MQSETFYPAYGLHLRGRTPYVWIHPDNADPIAMPDVLYQRLAADHTEASALRTDLAQVTQFRDDWKEACLDVQVERDSLRTALTEALAALRGEPYNVLCACSHGSGWHAFGNGPCDFTDCGCEGWHDEYYKLVYPNRHSPTGAGTTE